MANGLRGGVYCNQFKHCPSPPTPCYPPLACVRWSSALVEVKYYVARANATAIPLTCRAYYFAHALVDRPVETIEAITFDMMKKRRTEGKNDRNVTALWYYAILQIRWQWDIYVPCFNFGQTWNICILALWQPFWYHKWMMSYQQRKNYIK